MCEILHFVQDDCASGERVRGIEPPCAAWEAAVLPLNYTRKAISDFRFPIADCNRKCRTAVVCAVLSAGKIGRHRFSAEDSGRYSTQPAKITATKSRRRPRCQHSCLPSLLHLVDIYLMTRR